MVEKKKKNIFLRILSFLGKCIAYPIFTILFGLIWLIGELVLHSKVVGKKYIRKDDEARVFIANHYELYGPTIFILKFPYRSIPWIMDGMMEPELIDHQIGMNVYNNYKFIPKFIKKMFMAFFKPFVLFVFHHLLHAISVSRDYPKKNIITMKKSIAVLEKGKPLFICPEFDYHTEGGVGTFFSGFETIAKFYYKKTGKRISFYPIYISKINKKMYIGKPVVFNPNEDMNVEQERIVSTLHRKMERMWRVFEVNGKRYKKLKAKQEKRKLNKENKQTESKID
ncbi:MAG: hypothetical protein IJ538_03220 [Clostridia bacterium]|nr:hypothetical protein [Clostridia bacterium]